MSFATWFSVDLQFRRQDLCLLGILPASDLSTELSSPGDFLRS